MAEISLHGECKDSNPITESKLLLGIPRKQSHSSIDHCHGNDQPPIVRHLMNGQATVTDVGDDHGNNVPITGGGDDHTIDADDSSSSSASDDEEGEGSSESSDEEEEQLTEEEQLKNAGVDIDLHALGAPSEGCVAPLHLLSEVSKHAWAVCWSPGQSGALHMCSV